MHMFFNPDNLSAEQLARWDTAIAEYHRITAENIARDGGGEFASIMTAGQAGNPKSALFARLLSGKAALPYPPPVSFGYPWYAIIEDDRPHAVVVKPTYRNRKVIGINQQCWDVVTKNPAAQTLWRLQEELDSRAVWVGDADDARRVFHWDAALLGEVVAAYADRPEFVVKHTHWPEYRLHLGRQTGQIKRWFLDETVSQIANRQTTQLRSAGNVFDLPTFKLNHQIESVLHKGESVVEKLSKAKAQLAATESADGHGSTFMAHIQQSANRSQIQSLEAAIASGVIDVHDAARDDTVSVSYLSWVLERAG